MSFWFESRKIGKWIGCMFDNNFFVMIFNMGIIK